MFIVNTVNLGVAGSQILLFLLIHIRAAFPCFQSSRGNRLQAVALYSAKNMTVFSVVGWKWNGKYFLLQMGWFELDNRKLFLFFFWLKIDPTFPKDPLPYQCKQSSCLLCLSFVSQLSFHSSFRVYQLNISDNKGHTLPLSANVPNCVKTTTKTPTDFTLQGCINLLIPQRDCFTHIHPYVWMMEPAITASLQFRS